VEHIQVDPFGDGAPARTVEYPAVWTGREGIGVFPQELDELWVKRHRARLTYGPVFQICLKVRK
jgi:hypothetical protein